MAKRKVQPDTPTPQKQKSPLPKGIVFLRDEQMFMVIIAGRQNKYGIGSSVRVGDCGYVKARGAWTAKTLLDALQMAKDFAANMLKIEEK